MVASEETGIESNRIAVAAVCVGALAVVVAAAPYKLFELDRYFVPKELALHLTALLASLLCLHSARRLALTGVDTLLLLFVAISAISTLGAENGWVATRALAISLSGITLFWVARHLARAGLGRPIIITALVAMTLAAITSLAQAYGMESAYFSLNRSPGGTFGNRNFVAHLAAIAVPLLVLCTLLARSVAGVTLGACAATLLAATLLLSRSRAALVALAACVFVIVLGCRRANTRWPHFPVLRRLMLLAVAGVVGIIAAVAIPNTLEWKSDSPYLDTVTGVLNYREGSGRGRVLQYTNTLHMAEAHPVLGVGPGNWAVSYPRYAQRSDPSIDPDDAMTANPWPSSDWVAYVAERGMIATGALVLALAGLAIGAARALRRATSAQQYLAPVTLMATIAATVVVGCFDAVLLLPAPALLVWSVLGALASDARPKLVVSRAAVVRWLPALAATLLGLASLRGVGQLASMALYTSAERIDDYASAAIADPGSYRIQLRLAELAAKMGSCARVREHARHAYELFPGAPAPRRLLARCGVRVPAPH